MVSQERLREYDNLEIREATFSGVDEMNRILKEIALKQGNWLYGVNEDLRLLDMWFTQRSRGEGNPLHNHIPGDYSGFYIVSDGGGQGGTTTFVKDTGEEFSLAPVEGRVTMFPSTLKHRVDPHNGDQTRLSLAFNFVYK